jgi:hypothetical protein
MTMINRSSPEAPPTTALTDIEVQLLDRLIQEKTTQPQSNRFALNLYCQAHSIGRISLTIR